MLSVSRILRSLQMGAGQPTLLVMGLSRAGKTTLTQRLRGQTPTVAVPTFGYAECQLRLAGTNLRCVELGGARELRSAWPKFLRSRDTDLRGIIWVVDAADQGRMNEASQALDEVLDELETAEKHVPVLILANKCDQRLVLSEAEVAQRLALHSFGLEHKIASCSALSGEGVPAAMSWLAERVGPRGLGVRPAQRADVQIQQNSQRSPADKADSRKTDQKPETTQNLQGSPESELGSSTKKRKHKQEKTDEHQKARPKKEKHKKESSATPHGLPPIAEQTPAQPQ